MEPISSADARTQFSDILAKTFYQNKVYVIERCNKPMAILMSIEDFEKLKGGEVTPPAKKNTIKKKGA